MGRINVYTDREILALGLWHAISSSYLVEIRGFASLSTDPALLQADGLPDAVILDAAPEAVAIIQRLRAQGFRVPIAIWERVDASEPALNALSLGAQGVLLDTSSPADVMSCLKAIAGGGVWVPPSIAHAALVSRQCKVSKREGELMNLIACGLSNKEMAYRLGITVGTVKVYLSRLFDKLGVSDRYELALLALRQAGSSDASHRPADLCSRSVFVPRKAGDEWRLGAAGR